jgi:hypothetical protein
VADEDLFRRTFLRLLRMHLDMGATITAIGTVLQQADPSFEAKVGAERTAHVARAQQLYAAFEQAQTQEWLLLLDGLTGRTH